MKTMISEPGVHSRGAQIVCLRRQIGREMEWPRDRIGGEQDDRERRGRPQSERQSKPDDQEDGTFSRSFIWIGGRLDALVRRELRWVGGRD